MLQLIFEILFQIFFEFIFQVIVGALIEWGIGKGTYNKTVSFSENSLLVGIGYFVVGIILGAISGALIPIHLIENADVRSIVSVLSPIGLGLTLCLVSWPFGRRNLGEGLFSLPKFIQGVVFGAAYSVARFVMIATS